MDPAKPIMDSPNWSGDDVRDDDNAVPEGIEDMDWDLKCP